MMSDYKTSLTCLTQNYQYSNSDINNTNYDLLEYHQISQMRSNCIEFWAPITERVVPNIVPGRYWVSTYGNTWDTVTNRPFGLSINAKGYFQIPLRTKDGNRVTRKLHRLIMLTFCYVEGHEKLEVNHIDSNRQNNNLYNLEWVTSSENTIHGILHGNKKVFNNKINFIIPDEEINQILDMYHNKHYTVENIDKIFREKYPDMSESYISNVVKGTSRVSLYKEFMKDISK